MRTALRLVVVLGLLAGMTVVHPPRAGAQERAFGIGPRFSFVRGAAEVEGSAARFSGGQLRARLSPRTALELSLDYRSYVNDSLNERLRDYPVQGSLLLYPVRSTLAPYLLGGVGWYSQRVDTLVDNLVVDSATTRTFGYHAGLGGELRLGSRASVHLDYRYTKIRFGDSGGADTEPGAIPIPGLFGLQEKLKLSHEGSMWTSGLTIFF